LSGVLNLGHRLILAKNFIRFPFTRLWLPPWFFNWYQSRLGH
jgi:hypothetical protein